MSTTPTKAPPNRLLLEDIAILDSNPRGDVDTTTEAFDELVASIQRSGIVQPLLVGQPVETPDGPRWPLIAGHRRYAAAKKLALDEAPVLQADYGGDDVRARVAAIAENVNRLDLTPLQEARALKDLQKTGLTQLEAAEALGKSERWARERERLLNLPPKAAEAFDEGILAGPASVDLEKIAEQAPRMAEAVASSVRGAALENGPQLAAKGSVAGQVEHLLRTGLPAEKDGTSTVGCFVDADEPITYDDAVAAGIPHDKLREWKQRFDAVTKLISTSAVYRHQACRRSCSSPTSTRPGPSVRCSS
jgi:ParB/RepB/Spo0J family partition protein